MKKYKCHLCPKSYQSKKGLIKHLERIHGITLAKLEKHSDEEKSEFMNQCLELLDKTDKSSMKTKEKGEVKK